MQSQASRLTLHSSVAAATVAGVFLLAPATAWAQCVVGGTTVTCSTTTTTDTDFPANAPNDRNYQGNLPVPIVLTVDPGATISGNGIAISNSGNGGITVTNNGTISVDAGNAPTAGGTAALSLRAAGGPIVYTGGAITNNGSGNAFDATQTGGVGSVNIDISGAVVAATGNGVLVRDVAASSGISVTTGAVTALTAGKNAIDVQSQSLTGNVTEVANGNIQAGNAGMVGAILNAAATGNIDVTANGSIDARFGVDAENFGRGSTSVTTVGPVTATSGNGVFALSAGGNITVNAGSVSSTGNVAIIAQQTAGAGTGAISVTAGTVSGTTGIVANNTGSGAISITTTGTVTGTSAEGILATGRDAVSVSVANTVTGATRGLSVVGGTGGAGNISVTGTGGFVGGTGDAANIRNDGSGTTIVNISGASNSAGGAGIFVRDVAAGTGVSVTTGAVTALTAGQNAIDVQSQSLTGNVTEVANGNIQAGNAGMVAAILNAASTGNIDVTANGSIDARFGIDAENFGRGSTTVTAVGPITATSGNGIFALSAGGNVTVNAGSVRSVGNTAIIAQQTAGAGTGNVSVTTSGAVSGTSGILALNNGTGAVSVTVGGDVTATAGSGVVARNVNPAASTGTIDVAVGTGRTITATGGAGVITDSGLSNGLATVSLAGTVSGSDGVLSTSTVGAIGVTSSGGSVTGTAGDGIRATSVAGAIDVLIGGAVTGSSNGVVASSTSGNVTISGAGPVIGTTGLGIYAASRSGDVTIATNGTVTSTGGEAIRGVVGGAGAVTITTGGRVTSNGICIRAQSSNGAATITVNQNAASLISGTGGSGIRTDSGISTGATTINVAGEVRATGAGNAGVRASSTAGNITLNVAATGRIDPDIGADLNTVSGALTVNNAGLITGTITGVQLVATGSGTGTISNTGTITGGTNAVVASMNNAAFTLFNSGVLNGAINVGGSTIATSTFTNIASGTANLTGSSVFSGSLNNGGTINLAAAATFGLLGNVTNTGRVNFTGAGTLTTNGAMTNSGIINARNNLTSNVVTVVGNYTGGGQFFADYSTATNSADRLLIGGTASGNTNVVLNRIGGVNFVPGGFLPIVTVVPGAAATAFTSSTAFPTTGFILESFGRNPASSSQFGVLQTVNPVSSSLGYLSHMAEGASALLDDPISPFVANRAGASAGTVRLSVWMRLGTGHTKQTIGSTLSGGGVTYTGSNVVRFQHEAAQFGGDVGFLNLGGKGLNLNVGVMGGWYDGAAPVSGTERIKVETPFLGGYVTFGNGAFSIEGTVRKEWRNYTLPSLFGTAGTKRLDGSAMSYGFRTSYRVGGNTGFAATPFASFNYADSKIDPITIDALSAYTPGDDTTKVGQAGVRLSYRGGSETGLTLEPFASVARMENWSREDSSSFTFGAPVTSFTLDTVTWKNAMRYSLGVMGSADGGRISGFVVGNMNDGAWIKSYTLNAGLHFNF